MTLELFRDEPTLAQLQARVTEVTEAGVVLDATVFYPTGGGQPGDQGWLDGPGDTLAITGTVKGPLGPVHLLAPGTWPGVGDAVTVRLDWPLRHLHMRTHTALHLLSVVVPLPVTGGQIGPGRGRLDFDMPEAPGDIAALEAALNDLITADHPVTAEWISEAELDANPGLVKTMAVQPPRGQGRVRLVRIGAGAVPVDLQPCGGTHVASTAEVGRVRIEKIEKKGKLNRRIVLALD